MAVEAERSFDRRSGDCRTILERNLADMILSQGFAVKQLIQGQCRKLSARDLREFNRHSC